MHLPLLQIPPQQVPTHHLMLTNLTHYHTYPIVLLILLLKQHFYIIFSSHPNEETHILQVLLQKQLQLIYYLTQLVFINPRECTLLRRWQKLPI